MEFTINYSLDANEYSVMQDGYMSASLTNKSKRTMLICQVELDIGGDDIWYTDCNVQVEPDQTRTLPKVQFTIDVDAEIGAHLYRPGVMYKWLDRSVWGEKEEWFAPRGDHVMIKQAKSSNFEVFVSHSNAKEDKRLVKRCCEHLEKCGLRVYVAELSPKPGYPLWLKIEQAIRRADAILVVWTKEGAQSGDIREEIGIAVGSRKARRIVPLVETGVEIAGSLNSLEYVPFETGGSTKAMATVLTKLLDWAQKKEKARPKTKSSES